MPVNPSARAPEYEFAAGDFSMTGPPAIRNGDELLAHAIAIEREASARYAELGERMRDLGNDVVADLFLRLAALERGHQHALEQRAQGHRLPELAAAEHAWLDAGAPRVDAHALVLRTLTPHAALEIALDAERRALAFFEGVRHQAADPALAQLAADMAAEELEHVAWVEGALRRMPDPVIDWERVFG
jgi:rubrerythrin